MRNKIFIALPCVVMLTGLAWASRDGGVLPGGATADRIVVEKSVRRLTLMKNGAPLKTYRIALGRSPGGTKERRGDNRTPEGVYRIDRRNPKSRFYRSLHISYPNRNDVERARRQGVSPGGDIMIHGLPPDLADIGEDHCLVNWTTGCLAVTNIEIDEIWNAVPDGTTIEILP